MKILILNYKSSNITPSVSLNLSVRRLVKPNSPYFYAVVGGRISQMQQLFTDNEATPSDVHCNNGETALHVSKLHV